MKKQIFVLLFLCINLLAEERVITLSPSINEIVFALGMGDNIVANTKYCDYPLKSKSIKKVGGYASLSLEKILESNPSVVITQNYDQKLLGNLKNLNIKTLVFKTDTLVDIKNTILSLGTFFKKEERANELVSQINKNLLELKSITSNKKILIVISPTRSLSNQIYVTGNNIYFEDIIKASSNKNAYFSKSLSQPVLNTEKVIKLNPDIIILLAPYLGDKKEEQRDLIKTWKSLPINASKNNTIYIIDKVYAGIPSHRVKYFINDFRKILLDVRNK